MRGLRRTESKGPEIPGLQEVLERVVYEHSFSATDREVGGVLLGRIEPNRSPTVEAAIWALQASERAAQLTFTQDAWEHIHRVLEQQHPSLEIVGWYHTHPGYGVFLSEQDLFIHRNFFQNHGQIALVIDPIAAEEAVFAWKGDEITEYYRRKVPRRAAGERGGRAAGLEPGQISEARFAHPQQVGLEIANALPAGFGRPHNFSFTTAIYLVIIGLSAGATFWELFLR